MFRNWRGLLERQVELDRLKAPLRLPFAILHDLEPGLWRQADVKVAKADQTFSAKLHNLGSAVGVNK
jgi:hypothetical protein